MGLVRLANRSVIGAAERASDVAKALPELAKLGIQPVDVSILAKPEAIEANPAPSRGKGELAALGKGANWLVAAVSIARSESGELVGAGPLGSILSTSPSTSPTGALVMQGIPQREAAIYTEHLLAGKVLVMVGVADRVVGERVRSLLDRSGVESLTYYAGRPYGTAFHGTGPGLR